MASPKKEKQQKKTLNEKDAPLIPARYQHAAAVAVLCVSLIVFFNQILFSGKTFSAASDNVASRSWSTLLEDAKAANEFPLWNPYIFCGMPAYASLTVGGDRLFDITGLVLGKASSAFSFIVQNRDDGWIIFYYLIFAIGMYWFTYSKVNNKLASLAAALAATFSMFIIIWIMVGHNTKIAVIAYFPFIFAILENQRKKFNLLFSLILVLLLHFSFLPSHVQMIFYMYFALGIYYVFFLLRTIIKKEDWKGVLRSGVIFAFASVVAFSMDADKYLSTIEYNPYSIRGAAPIAHSSQEGQEKTIEGGLGYDYATNWSFSPGELMTFVLPSWYGFGWHTYSGPLTNGQSMRLNTYWGPQPQPVDAPQYMGVVILVLAVIGFVRNRKDPFVQYLGITICIALLISFGKEFSLIYDLMYRYFPAFNKFRIPSMILVLVQIFIPILAAYGITSFLNDRAKEQTIALAKQWRYTFVGFGIVLVIALVGRGFLHDVYLGFFPPAEVGKTLSQAYQQELPPQAITEFMRFVFDSVVTDLFVAVILLAIVFGAFYLYQRRSISLSPLALILIPAIVFDLWRIDFKPMEVQDRHEQKQTFAAPDYVKFLEQDTTLYRTLEFVNGQPPYSNTLAYWRIQSAYGYHGAKIRAYQDLVEVVGLQNPLLWGLMNVKYIITNREISSASLEPVFKGPERSVYRNRAALARAFFVNRYEVTNSLDVLHRMTAMNFDPQDVVFLADDPGVKIDPPGQGAEASFTHYSNQDFSMNVTATGNNFLFLSEAFYPKGWNAYLDGKLTSIYRADYHFRGVIVAPGKHTLEMKFEPKGFYLGKEISLFANIAVVGALVLLGGLSLRKKRASEPPANTP